MTDFGSDSSNARRSSAKWRGFVATHLDRSALEKRNAAHRRSVLAARVIVTADAMAGRDSDPKVVDLAKQTIFSPYGAEIRYRWPEKTATEHGSRD